MKKVKSYSLTGKRIFILVILVILNIKVATSQITFSPSVSYSNNIGIIDKIELNDRETIVTLKYPRQKGWLNSGSWIRIDLGTFLIIDGSYAYDYLKLKNRFFDINFDYLAKLEGCYLIEGLGNGLNLGEKYDVHKGKQDYFYIDMYFRRIPRGVESITIKEIPIDGGGFIWGGIKINNPY